MTRRVAAEHGVIYARPDDDRFGYFGWPTLARLEDGSLAVAVSGFRHTHICPFGKTVLFYGAADGRSWSEPEIVNDSPIDDRDAGLTPLAGNRLLLSWFTSDTRRVFESRAVDGVLPIRACGLDFRPALYTRDDAEAADNVGSFLRLRRADGSWAAEKTAVRVSAPHGPIRLRDGRLFYLGNTYGKAATDGTLHFSWERMIRSRVLAMVGDADGRNWREAGVVPTPADGRYCEAHAIELADGAILALLRLEGEKELEIHRTVSRDGGESWTPPVFVAAGGPPHLMRHSSGALLCVYGYREPGYGERAMISRDEGTTWATDLIIRDDGVDGDLGYPSSAELPDGRILTVYYQKPAGNRRNCGLLYSIWELPAGK